MTITIPHNNAGGRYRKCLNIPQQLLCCGRMVDVCVVVVVVVVTNMGSQ
jgi:hypothetical protein